MLHDWYIFSSNLCTVQPSGVHSNFFLSGAICSNHFEGLRQNIPWIFDCSSILLRFYLPDSLPCHPQSGLFVAIVCLLLAVAVV